MHPRHIKIWYTFLDSSTAVFEFIAPQLIYYFYTFKCLQFFFFLQISHHETVRATTTLTVDKNGPITATSVIESVPKDGALPPKSPGFAVSF